MDFFPFAELEELAKKFKEEQLKENQQASFDQLEEEQKRESPMAGLFE